MQLSDDKLASAAECDSVIAMINKDKSGLLYQKGLLDHRLELISVSSTEIASEMIILNSRITGYEGIDQTLPAGDAKNENLKDLENAKHRRFLLNLKSAEQGSVALLGIEIDLAKLAAQQVQLDDALTAVTARKATF